MCKEEEEQNKLQSTQPTATIVPSVTVPKELSVSPSFQMNKVDQWHRKNM